MAGLRHKDSYVLLLLDSLRPGFLMTQASVEQSFGMAATLAVAGLFAGPVLGLLVGFPLLLALQRSRIAAVRWAALAGSIAGPCVAFAFLGIRADAAPLAVACTAIFAFCSWLAATILRRDVAHSHVAQVDS